MQNGAAGRPSPMQRPVDSLENIRTEGQNGRPRAPPDELMPARFLKPSGMIISSSYQRTNMIILNVPIEDFDYIERLYCKSSYLLCADGGANRLAYLLREKFPNLSWPKALQKCLPNIIHGDLDSLDDFVRAKYEELGVEISQDPDQYSTDFGKAVKKVVERNAQHVGDILVVGSLGGRVDQGIGLLGELYRQQVVQYPGIRFYLFSESSVSTILRPGTTIISLEFELEQGLITKNVGILPVYGPAVISTEGLEWDVKDWPTEMGGQMSTSNHLVKGVIKITTSHYVLFTMERGTDDDRPSIPGPFPRSSTTGRA